MTGLPEVKISLVAVGADGVEKAFKTIEQASMRFQSRLSDHQSKGETKRVTSQAREEAAKTRTLATEGKKREQAAEREYANLERTVERWRKQEIAAEKAKNRELEAESKRSATARANFFRGVARSAIADMQSMASKAAGFAGAVLGIAGGFSIADAIGGQLKAEGKAKEISLNSRGETSKGEVLRKAELLGKQGFDRTESLNAIDAFIAKTGDAKIALNILEEIGDVANATGADFQALATTAGIAWNAMTPDEKARPGALMEIVRTQAAQAREAALDPKDTAGNWGRVYASSAQFQGGVTANSRFLGALTQMSAMGGTSTDAAEATESAKSLSLDVQTHKKELAKMGITDLTYGPANQLRDVQTVFERLMVGTQGDLGKLENAGVGRRSVRLFEAPANYYKQAFADAKKSGRSDKEANQAGLDASRKALQRILDASLSQEQVKKEAAERTAEADKQLQIVMEELKTQVGTKLVPEFIKLIPLIAQATPHIMKLLDALIRIGNWVAENPWKAAIAACGLAMIKSITLAFGSEAIAAAIRSGFGASTGSALASSAPSVGAAGGSMIARVGVVALAAGYSSDNEQAKRRENLAAAEEGQDEARSDFAAGKRLERERDQAKALYEKHHDSYQFRADYVAKQRMLDNYSEGLVRRVGANNEAMNSPTPNIDPVKAEAYNKEMAAKAQEEAAAMKVINSAATSLQSSAQAQERAAQAISDALNKGAPTDGRPLADGTH